ncbi:hypothetical protein HG536_0H03220 [Torulaspora globosa]|uniref:5-hydroxyisourate hydrolase n=1 Tax=Torulaspora globosa TaxID=48254 RepID=A0A7G3ZN61_9SACH|nr:uncharacterized protein HG536_0H03220 [Torulaspora globosa]QLL34947.1 hypothetical protein HG536_0H03220 [Torulaspora globosa]
MSERPPVTCHVLDTATGKPAANVVCSVYKIDLVEEASSTGIGLLREASTLEPFAMARTDADGRVPRWTFDPTPSKRQQLEEVGVVQDTTGDRLHWEKLPPGTYKIRFHAGQYYKSLGQTNFHPFADVIFTVEDSRHYHIPLLLSNYGYTTYRGS